MRLSVPFLTLLLALIAAPAFAQLQQSSYGFLSLSGRNERANAVITWETIQELTITQFNIQQSTDGNHFVTVGTVASGRDSAKSSINYRFVDAGAGAHGRLLYYRLEIVVNNGRLLYSKTFPVRFDASGDEHLTLYPNITRSTLSVSVESAYEGQATMQIIDLAGNVVQQQTLATQSGSWLRTIDVSRLTTGHYVLAVLGNGLRLQQRFFRQ